MKKSWPMLLALVPLLAQADLYRWVDPATGSIKFSNSPPAWLEGPAQTRPPGPAVEVVPYRAAPPAFPSPRSAPALPAALEAKSQAASGPAPAEGSARLAALEAQWRNLLKSFSSLSPRTDFESAGTGLRQQLQSYEAVVAELDQRDPAGAARRRAEESTVLERVRKGLEAQFGGRLPPEQK